MNAAMRVNTTSWVVRYGSSTVCVGPTPAHAGWVLNTVEFTSEVIFAALKSVKTIKAQKHPHPLLLVVNSLPSHLHYYK